MPERLEGGLNDVGVIARAQGFREYVFDAGRFNDRAYATAGNDAGARGSRAQQHAAAAKLADHLVGNRVLENGKLDHGFARGVAGFADGLTDLIGLAEAAAHLAVMISGDDQRAEAETPAALDHLGASVDEHHFFGRLATYGDVALAGVAVSVTAAAAVLITWRHKK